MLTRGITFLQTERPKKWRRGRELSLRGCFCRKGNGAARHNRHQRQMKWMPLPGVTIYLCSTGRDGTEQLRKATVESSKLHSPLNFILSNMTFFSPLFHSLAFVGGGFFSGPVFRRLQTRPLEGPFFFCAVVFFP